MNQDLTNSMLVQVRTEIKKLQNVEAALMGVAVLPSVPGPKQKPAPSRQKAPNGTLQAAILKALPGKKLTNGELRSALEKKGYTYSLRPELVRQTLVKMRKDKEVVLERDGGEVRYSLPKS
jgi:hypothetical protein